MCYVRYPQTPNWGRGNMLLEAMASGLPVVSVDCDWGPREMVTDGHDGLLVKAGDVPALARSLARVIRDPRLRERLGGNAFLTAQKYSLDRVMAEWDRIPETVLPRPRLFDITNLQSRNIGDNVRGHEVVDCRPGKAPSVNGNPHVIG